MKNTKLITLIAGALLLTQSVHAAQELDQNSEYNKLDVNTTISENGIDILTRELEEVLNIISQKRNTDQLSSEEKNKLLSQLEALEKKAGHLRWEVLPSKYDLENFNGSNLREASKTLLNRIEACGQKIDNFSVALFRAAIQLEPAETPNCDNCWDTSLTPRFAGEKIPKSVILTPEQIQIAGSITSGVTLVKEKVEKLDDYIKIAQSGEKELSEEEQKNIESHMRTSAQEIGHYMFNVYNEIKQLRSEVEQKYGESTAKIIFGEVKRYLGSSLDPQKLGSEHIAKLATSIRDLGESMNYLRWQLSRAILILENIKVDKNLILDETALYPVRTEPIRVPLGKTFSLRLRGWGCCGGRQLDTPLFSPDALEFTRNTHCAASGFSLLIPEQTQESDESEYLNFLSDHIKERGIAQGRPCHIFNFKAIKEGSASVFIPSTDSCHIYKEQKETEPALGNYAQFIIE